MRLSSALVGILLQGLQCCDARALRVPKTTLKVIAPRWVSDQASCTHKSPSPGWDVLGLAYNRLNFGPPCVSPSGSCSGPGGGTPPLPLYYGELVFDVVNRATNESHHCDVRALSLSDLNPGGEEWLPCIDSIIFINLPEYATNTMFRVVHTSNSLELNQTWTCDAQGHNFTAYGKASPVLDPGASYIGDGNLGEVHARGISPNISIPGTLMSHQIVALDQH